MSGPNVGRPWTGPLRGECRGCGNWFTLRWSKTVEGAKIVNRHKVHGEVCRGAERPPIGEVDSAHNASGPWGAT